MGRLLRAIALAVGFCAIGLSAYGQTSELPVRYIIVDSSGSMDGAFEGRKKIDVARDIVRREMDSLTPNQSVALLTFGADETKSCRSIDTLVGIGGQTNNRPGIESAISTLKPGGSTPIAASLERAVKELDGRPAEIVLVTDGLDSCNRNVCALARGWRERALNITVRVRSVGMDPVTRDELSCLAQTEAVVPAPIGPGTVIAQPSPSPVAAGSELVAARPMLANMLSIVFGGLCILLLAALSDLRIISQRLGADPDRSSAPETRVGVLLHRRARSLRSTMGIGVVMLICVGLFAWLLMDQGTVVLRSWWWFANTDFGSSLLPSALVAFAGWLALRLWSDYSDEAIQLKNEVAASGGGDEPIDVSADGSPESRASREKFQKVADEVRKLKDKIEEKIALLDGRRLRKYANLKRYDYGPIVKLLADDDEWAKRNGVALANLFSRWRQHRTGYVDDSDIVDVQRMLKAILD